MSSYRRARTGSTFFFTLVSYKRRTILCHDSLRTSLRTAILNVRATRPFTIDAWVLMPDHLHCIWTLPDGDSDYSSRWLQIKRSVSRFTPDLKLSSEELGASARKHRDAAIWQRRFWEHQIRDNDDLERHVDYIHYNPVRHGYVQLATDWPYSTIHRYVEAGWYPVDWAGGENVEWGDFE